MKGERYYSLLVLPSILTSALSPIRPLNFQSQYAAKDGMDGQFYMENNLTRGGGAERG